MNEVDAIDQNQKRHQLNLCTRDSGTGNHHTNQVDGVEGDLRAEHKGEQFCGFEFNHRLFCLGFT